MLIDLSDDSITNKAGDDHSQKQQERGLRGAQPVPLLQQGFVYLSNLHIDILLDSIGRRCGLHPDGPF